MSLTDTERAHIQATLQKQRDALAALRFTGSPATSQTRAVVSTLAEASRPSVGEKARALTRPRWPGSAPILVPTSTSHR